MSDIEYFIIFLSYFLVKSKNILIEPVTIEVTENVPEYSYEVAAQEDKDDQLEGPKSEND
jgi:hypothetical protein